MADTLVNPMLQSVVNKLVTMTFITTMPVLDLSSYNILFWTDRKKVGGTTAWALAASFQKRQV